MDLIDQLRAFVATAQTGSFTAAAERIGISNRLTSKYVAELEQRLGTRLFQRTTRRVGLTPAGSDLLTRAPALLDDLDTLLAEVGDGSKALTGTLRVSAPVTLGELYLGAMLGRFAQAHPQLHIDLRLDDSFADLAGDGIDLAFRLGRSDMASLKTRKLGEFGTVIAASPDYVARAGAPQAPGDLARHDCIVDTNRRLPRAWSMVQDGATVTVPVDGRLQVNSARAAVALAVAGLGIVNAPRFALHDELASGALVPLLRAHTGPGGPLSAVWLEGRTLPRKVRALIDFAAEDIRQAAIL